MAANGLAVAYNDVLLHTGYSNVLPTAVSLETRFSRRVSLKIPVASAAMDTVTESPMAIALAKLGGIGIIHKNLTPKEQGDEVRRVKYHLSGRIAKPITVGEHMTLAEIEAMRREHKFSFHSFPVVNENGKLVGLLTENDFDFGGRFERASDVMTRELITANPKISVDEAYERMRDAKKKVLPLVNDDGSLAGMYLFSDLKRIKSGDSDTHNIDDQGRLRVGAAVGVGEDAERRLEVLRGYVDVIVIDTAHGDSENVFRTLRALKQASAEIDVVAGNVSEAASAVRLVNNGADGVKVGQGPGSICTTRVVAGVGCPQVTAIYSVNDAIAGYDVPVCADGGIENSAHIAIAIGAGAHSVMMGSLLARTKESPGEVDFRLGDAGPMKRYRGMGSQSALEESAASRERYLQEGVPRNKLVPEGVEAAVPYVGDLETVMTQYLGGLRAAMGYVGAATINEFRENATFYRITPAGIKESHPHGVHILRPAPNYDDGSSQ